MIENLYEYYKKDLRTIEFLENRTEVKINRAFKLLIVSAFIYMLAAISIFFAVDKYSYFLIFIFSIVLFIISIAYLNYLFKKATFKLIKLESNSFMWNSSDITEALFKLKVVALEDYIRNHIKDNRTHRLLKQELDNTIDAVKPKFPIIPSFIGVISTIFLDKIISKYFDLVHLNNLSDLLRESMILGISMFFIISTSLLFYYLILKPTFVDIMSTKYNNYIYLKRLVNEVNMVNDSYKYRVFE